MNKTTRKKRSGRRPRNDIQPEDGSSSLSSSPPSDYGRKGISDDNMGWKILDSNQFDSRASSDAEMAANVGSEFEIRDSSDDKDTGLGTSEVLASNSKETKYDTTVSSGHKSGSLEVDSDGKVADNVVKKVKLKVGGVIRTIHAKPSSDPDVVASKPKSSILKPAQHFGTSRLKQKSTFQDNQDQDYPVAQDKRSGLQGIPWKDFSGSSFFVEKVDSSHDSVQKSNSVPKRKLYDDDDEDEDDDAELRYLAKMKLKSAKVDDEDGGRRKQRKISSVIKMEGTKKSKTGREIESEDTDYRDEKRSPADMFGENFSREMTITTRRKAQNLGRDISAISTPSVVEFPHGLPPAPPRKQKDKPSEVEHQLKKAEAAERRRMQAAKAAQESEAEAIRKILGQDSSRKRRENKMKQRQEELAQERTSNAAMLASNTVRWVVRPTGTVVTFSDDIGFPNIFESRPCSYPPPREKCAGPSCSQPFKYRDSRSKLPLCSLQCYKAVQEKSKSGAVY